LVPYITGTVTPGKVVDNGGHKYNAAYNMPVTAAQFGIAMATLSRMSGSAYDLNHFNCVDFTLSVINSFRPTTPIIPGTPEAAMAPAINYPIHFESCPRCNTPGGGVHQITPSYQIKMDRAPVCNILYFNYFLRHLHASPYISRQTHSTRFYFI
jgi:hypothetical protein